MLEFISFQNHVVPYQDYHTPFAPCRILLHCLAPVLLFAALKPFCFASCVAMVDCCEIYHEEPPKQQKKKEIKEKPREEEEKRSRESPKKVDQRHDCKSRWHFSKNQSNETTLNDIKYQRSTLNSEGSSIRANLFASLKQHFARLRGRINALQILDAISAGARPLFQGSLTFGDRSNYSL